MDVEGGQDFACKDVENEYDEKEWDFRTSIRLLGISPKACYTLAKIGSRSCLTSSVHSAYNCRNSRKGKMPE